MPRQFFRRLSPSRARVSRQRWLKPFRGWLDHPDLWAIRRKAVAPGIALGLFWTWVPIPGHSIAAGISAIALRVHLPLAVVMTALVNPLTIVPIYYSGYLLGKNLLQSPDLSESLSWDAESIGNQLDIIWQPLLLGNVILGLISAAIGYLLVDILWRTRIGNYLTKRRERLDRQRL
ncbi:MAG: DUF2062 domain-containing protein [Woeseiaceae bacterium]